MLCACVLLVTAEISSVAGVSLMLTGVKGDNDAADDDDDDAGVEMASDHSTQSPPPPPCPNKPSSERATEADRQPPSSSSAAAAEEVSAGTRTAVEDRAEEEDAPAEDGEEDEYRCDVCHAIFASWRRFMDHRNYDCASGMESALLLAGQSWPSPYSPIFHDVLVLRAPGSIKVSMRSPPSLLFMISLFPR